MPESLLIIFAVVIVLIAGVGLYAGARKKKSDTFRLDESMTPVLTE